MTADITELAQSHELLIANGQQTADLLRHLADNEIDSDYFAVVSECESYGKETDAELSITEFALRAAGYVDALVEALASEKRICATWRKTAEANSEKLEKAQQQTTESENRVRKQNRHICELFDDNTALRQRIAELESRAVKLIDCDFGAVQHMSGGSTDYCNGFVDGTQNAIRSITAAGIKVEAE